MSAGKHPTIFPGQMEANVLFTRICLGSSILTMAIGSKNCTTFSSNQKYIKTFRDSLALAFPRFIRRLQVFSSSYDCFT